MKTLLFLLCCSFSFTTSSQSVSGLWIPLKRVELIDRLKMDKCDSLNEYPFKKIKFLNKTSVSLFGFGASDPDVCTIIAIGKGVWRVQDSVLNTLDPDFTKGSKIILRIKSDTLFSYLIKRQDTLLQKFVRKYANVNLTSYAETEIGNLLLRGNYVEKGNVDTIQFSGNGRIIAKSNKNQGLTNFISYRFKFYSKECNPANDPNRVIELTRTTGNKENYLIKSTAQGFDFYKIRKMKDWATVGEMDFAFSLSRLN